MSWAIRWVNFKFQENYNNLGFELKIFNFQNQKAF